MVYLAIDQTLERHELIKVKFLGFKEEDSKQQITASIEHNVGCHLAGITGHTALFYRPHSQVGKRRIKFTQAIGVSSGSGVVLGPDMT